MAEASDDVEIKDEWTDDNATDDIDGTLNDGNLQVNVDSTLDDVSVEPDESFCVKEESRLVSPSFGRHLPLKVYTGQRHIESCDPKCSRARILDDCMITSVEKPNSFDTTDFGSIQGNALLKVPMRNHTEEKPFKCFSCDYRCKFANNLKVHLKTHCGKLFSCNVCDYRCAKPTVMKVHMRIHSREKPYSCDTCAFRSWQPQKLRDHMRVHTGEMSYSCTLCDYKCDNPATLRHHSKFHTGEKAYYACGDCNFRCGAAVKMRNHMWKNHS